MCIHHYKLSIKILKGEKKFKKEHFVSILKAQKKATISELQICALLVEIINDLVILIDSLIISEFHY